jgi:hypothetical protein
VRFVLLATAVFLLFVARKPDALLNPQFWAEDGRIFFRDQLLFGAAESLSRHYMGYYQPVQRVTATFASAFPVVYAPLVYNMVALVVGALCCSIFFLPRYRCLIESDFLRLAVCLLAASAFYVDELVGTITNVHWFLFLAGILLVSCQRATKINTAAYASVTVAIAFLLGLSAPMLIIVLPLAAFWAIKRNWKNAIIAMAVTAGAILQTGAALVHSDGIILQSHSPITLITNMVDAFVSRVALQSLLGYALRVKISQGEWSVFIIAAAIMLAAWLIWLGARVPKEKGCKLLVAIYFAFASIAIAIPSRQVDSYFTGLAYAGERGERYFFVACCILAFLIALTLEVLPLRREPVRAVLLMLIFAGGMYSNFRIPPLPDLEWRHHAPAIERWVRDTRLGLSTQAVSVPINPAGWGVGAQIELPGR